MMPNVTPSAARYLALTTYRRDGRPVTTPVWSAFLDGKSTLSLPRAPAKPGGSAPRVGCGSPRAT